MVNPARFTKQRKKPRGSAMLRAGNTFKSRKLVKVHQNVLIFYKGNMKNIKQNFKEIDFSGLDIFSEESSDTL